MKKIYSSKVVTRALAILLTVAMVITLMPPSQYVKAAETPAPKGTDVGLLATASASGEEPADWGVGSSNMNKATEPASSAADGDSWIDWNLNQDDTTSWVQYDWTTDVTINSMSVYWMCNADATWLNRIPKSVKVEYKDASGNWQTAATYSSTVMAEQVKDQYNELPLDKEITTKSIRMTMERNADKFCSILRWRVWGKVTPVDVGLKATASASGEEPADWGVGSSNINKTTEPASSAADGESWIDWNLNQDDTTSWVQYDWTGDVTVDSMSVYWMCNADATWANRIPKSVKVEYKDASGNWQIAATYSSTVMAEQVKDQYNVLPLDKEITTKCIRMTMERNADKFCSILRWRVWGQGPVGPVVPEEPLSDTPTVTKITDGYKMVNKYFIVETGKYGQITSLQLQGDQYPTNYVMNAKNSSAQNTDGHQWMGELMFNVKVGDATVYTEQNTNRSNSGRIVELKDDKVIVTYEKATEEKGIKDFKVVETYSIVANKLHWEITVTNTNDQKLTIGDFGLPLAFNEFWTAGDQIYETRALDHSFVAKQSSYIYVTRPSGVGNFLLMTPDTSTGAGFEYQDHWRTQERAADENAWCQDQSGWQNGLNVFYIHSDNIKKTNRGYLENTKLELASGESKTYAFDFSAVKDETDMKSTLYKAGVIDAVAVPGMTYSINMPGKLYLHTAVDKSDISFEIQCPHEMSIYNGTGMVSNLLPEKKTAENTYVKYDKTVTIDGEQYLVYDIHFGDLGQNNVVVKYKNNDVASETVLQFYMMDDVAAALTTHSDFMVNNTQFNTPLKVSDKIFDDWMMDSKTKRADTDPTYWQKNYWGWGDDWALTHGEYIAEKNVYQPIAKEIKAVDDYLDIAIWNGLMREHQKDYYIHDFLMESPNSSPSVRGYAYPHIYNTFFSMYKIASRYPAMITYSESADTYLLRAYNIMKALYDPTINYNYSTGIMGELTTPDIIAALEKEGYYKEAQTIRDIMAKKYVNFKDTKYPYGSEYSYDNTGEEAVYTLAKMNIATDKANAVTMMNKINLKTRACRGLQPLWYQYANPTTNCGENWWQFQYTASLAGYCMDDWLRLEDNNLTETESATASRVNYAAKLANLTCINSGQIDADSANIGAVSWTYQAEMGNLGGQGTGEGQLHNGWRQMSGESDLGLFGALQILSSDVAIDPVFGLFGYGCNVTENSGIYSVTPLDGLFTRLNFINQKLYIELDRDQYTEAKVAKDNTSIELSMKNLEKTAHNSDVEITGLVPGSYQVAVDGNVTGSFQVVNGTTSTVTLSLPAAATATVTIKAGAALENKAPDVTLDATKTVAISDKTRLEADATDDGYVNSTLAYSWEVVTTPEGAAATLATPSKHITDVTFDKPGEYVFKFTANDGGLSTSKQITVIVTENPILPEVIANFTFEADTVTGSNKLVANSTVGSLSADFDDNSVLVDGKVGKGVQYNGKISGGYVELPEALTKNLTQATISTDVYLTAGQSNFTTLFELGSNIVVEFVDGNVLSLTVNGKQASTGVEFATGYWKNVELTANGDDYALYIDGLKKAELLDTGLVLADINTENERYLIGRSKAEADPFLKGIIDNFIVKSVVMTDEELKAAYNTGVHTIVSSKAGSVITNVGVEPILPLKVNALFSDCVYEKYDAIWDTVAPESYASAGTFNVNGKLKDTDIAVTLRVIVVAGTLQNVAAEANPSAIYNNPDDLGGVAKLNDGFDPANSADTSHGTWHNWGGNNGAQAWVQYNWDKEQIIASMDAYFFKDGNGNFSPASYFIEYLDESGNWYSVTNAVGLGINANQYNTTSFDPVITKGIRMTLNPATQGSGVIEWKVYGYKDGAVIDKAALNVAIATATSLNKDLFSAGMDAVTAALDTAKVVVADKNSTQDAIDAITLALNTAICSLTPVLANNMAYCASVATSFTSGWEHASAVNDGVKSDVSNTSGINHWGTWGNKNAASESVTYSWGLPMKINSSDLYIWNDGGGIKTPTKYVYEYKDNEGNWKEVTNASGYSIDLDKFNTTTFDEITTTAIRVTLTKETSEGDDGVGLVEWNVYGTTLQKVPDPIITTNPLDVSAIPNKGTVIVTISSAVTGSAIAVTGSALAVTGSAITVTGSALTVTGSALTVTGSALTVTGSALAVTGSALAATGSALAVTGSALAATGSALAATGSALATTGSAIYYTTDGSAPTTGSTKYTGEFIVSTSNTAGEAIVVKAIEVIPGYLNSSVALKTIIFLKEETTVTPTPTPTPNTDTPTPTPSPTPTPAPTPAPVVVKGDSNTASSSLTVKSDKELMKIAVNVDKDQLKKQLEEAVASEKNIVVPIITNDLIDETVSKGLKEVNISVALPSEILSSDNLSHANISLPQELLKAAKEKEMDLSVSVTDEKGKELYTWNFDGKALSNSDRELIDANLSLSVAKVSDQAALGDVLSTSSEAENGLVINFNHEGVLPAQASVRVYVGNLITTGHTEVYLYHFNPETKKLETLPYSSHYYVDSQGYITVNVLHCSDYVVLTKPADSKAIVSLLNQIKVTPTKKTLYVEGTKDTNTNITVTVPSTLEVVKSLNDKTSSSAIGAVVITYKSSDEKVATVDANGMITAVGAGKATIYTEIELYNHKYKTVSTKITVKKAATK